MRTVDGRIEDIPAKDLRELRTDRKEVPGPETPRYRIAALEYQALGVATTGDWRMEASGGALKKRRRIEVLIERRELSIFGISPLVGGAKPASGEGGAGPPGDPEKDEEQPPRCPTCGSTEMLRLSEAMALVALHPVPPGSNADRSDVHCTFSISEECWVCKPSLRLG